MQKIPLKMKTIYKQILWIYELYKSCIFCWIHFVSFVLKMSLINTCAYVFRKLTLRGMSFECDRQRTVIGVIFPILK